MNAAKKLIQDFETLNVRHGLLSRGDVVIIGLSGGPDSAALLFLMTKLRRKYGLTLEAAHLDHGLSRQNRDYLATARRLCKAWGVPLHFKRVRVAGLAKRESLSVEEAGRIERYRYFEGLAGRRRNVKIATAHTLDDQAETMLLRLIRGTGLRGLRAIVAKRRHGRQWIVRPLLNCRKSELLKLLRTNGVPFCLDRSNKSSRFTRNRIRNVLLPLLAREYNPLIAESMASLQAVCAEAQDFLEKTSRSAQTRCLAKRIRKGKVVLKTDPLKRLHPALLREVLCRASEAARGDLRQLGHTHIEAMARLAVSEAKQGVLHLPGGFRVERMGDHLLLRLARPAV